MIGHSLWGLLDCASSAIIAPEDSLRYFVSSLIKSCWRTLEASEPNHPKHLLRNLLIPDHCLLLLQCFKLFVDGWPVAFPQVVSTYKSLLIKSVANGHEGFDKKGRDTYKNGKVGQESFVHLEPGVEFGGSEW